MLHIASVVYKEIFSSMLIVISRKGKLRKEQARMDWFFLDIHAR